MKTINRTGFYLFTILLLLICGSCSRNKEIDFKSRVNAGYSCFMVLSVDVPDGVVIMTNGDSGEQLLWKVFDLIAYAYNWSV